MSEKHKMNVLEETIKSILGGLAIGLAATAYMVVDNHVFGSLLFALGLFTIYTFELDLFTGKIGFALDDKNILKLIIVWLGNFIGCYLFAICMKATRLISDSVLVEEAVHKVETKLDDSYLSIFVLGIFCGFLMYVVAKAFKMTQNTPNSVGGYISMFIAVPTFLYLGFEHCIANIYYVSIAGMWSFDALLMILVATLGNTVGAIMLGAYCKVYMHH